MGGLSHLSSHLSSMLFDRGKNAKQVQMWLGHHSPSFTLDTYVHLFEDDLGEPLTLSTERRPPSRALGSLPHHHEHDAASCDGDESAAQDHG